MLGIGKEHLAVLIKCVRASRGPGTWGFYESIP